MMPLCFADLDADNTIKKSAAARRSKSIWKNLGFVVGGSVRVISRLGENVIVNVKEARVAISEEMARRIMV